MAHEATAKHLPLQIIGQVEVGRLLRELDALETFLTQSEVREPGSKMTLPRTSKNLESLAEEKELNLLRSDDRKAMKDFLQDVHLHAPVVHMSFVADPSVAFLQKIAAWFRKEIHPNVLIKVGLQPSIAAGCTVRTTNKYFDFSLRRNLNENRDILVQKISGRGSND